MKSYQELQIWQRGIDLAVITYQLTNFFPKEELYGMTSQLRRAANSVPANISEGWGRNNNKEFRNFLRIANGSLKELETHLILAEKVNLCSLKQIQPLLEISEILGKQILSFQRSISQKKT
ncbi:MAG: four helix bundle protein [Chitinophagaceae bacterium]|nr:four helix bundle protein [Chitinophagaceae bacterium]